jgi:hypothetical protein
MDYDYGGIQRWKINGLPDSTKCQLLSVRSVNMQCDRRRLFDISKAPTIVFHYPMGVGELGVRSIRVVPLNMGEKKWARPRSLNFHMPRSFSNRRPIWVKFSQVVLTYSLFAWFPFDPFQYMMVELSAIKNDQVFW